MATVHIELYNNTQRENLINKTLENGVELTGDFHKEVSIYNPVVLIERIDTVFNYCYIQELMRYYFVRSYTLINSKTIQLQLELDVLKTYENEISTATGTIIEMDNANKYFSGYDTKHDTRAITQKIDFENNFNTTGNIIMVVIRGDK